MKILYEYIGGLGDILIDFAYFKKYKEKFPDHEIHISTDPTSAGLFDSFQHVTVAEVKPFNTPPVANINKYDRHQQITGLMSWAFYVKHTRTLFNARGDAFFPNVEATIDDMQDNIPLSMPSDILNDFDNPVIFSAPQPQRVAQGKTISEELWSEIFNYFKNITFIQIGSKNLDYSFNLENVVDIRDKLSIPNTLSLIPQAKFLLGVDNILNHASACFKKRGLFFWGSTNPVQYGYKQNINLYNPKDCSPCLYNRLTDNSECCQYPSIDTIKFNEIKNAIEKLLKEI
tara:strand:+ start:158 stop:1018 length:861 start_codon:yes stop_codon:yes gene_type:complete